MNLLDNIRTIQLVRSRQYQHTPDLLHVLAALMRTHTHTGGWNCKMGLDLYPYKRSTEHTTTISFSFGSVTKDSRVITKAQSFRDLDRICLVTLFYVVQIHEVCATK